MKRELSKARGGKIMGIAIIADAKSEELEALRSAFLNKGFEKAPFLKTSKVGLYSDKKKTEIVVGNINFKKYDAVYLQADSELTQFVEPFLDELVEQGIYCQAKPDSYYSTTNKPLMYTILNAKGIPISKTAIVGSPIHAESATKGFAFPLSFKPFSGQKKTQQLILDSERSLKSAAKSIKGGIDAVVLQEYLEGDLNYCFVVGKKVTAVRRKWDSNKQEHNKKTISYTLPEGEAETALKTASAMGLDIATVKMISGKVINVMPSLDFERFKKAVGSALQERIAEHYWEVLNR